MNTLPTYRCFWYNIIYVLNSKGYYELYIFIEPGSSSVGRMEYFLDFMFINKDFFLYGILTITVPITTRSISTPKH